MCRSESGARRCQVRGVVWFETSRCDRAGAGIADRLPHACKKRCAPGSLSVPPNGISPMRVKVFASSTTVRDGGGSATVGAHPTPAEPACQAGDSAPPIKRLLDGRL
jgi:hypothetical protein